MIEIKVEIYEESTISEPQIFTAKTKVDIYPENDIIGRGYTPEEALEAWLYQLQKHEFFREA